MREPRYRAGDVVGPWRLEDLLGTGRNGEVWSVNASGPKALKVLASTNPESESFLRFRDEKTILETLKGRPGVLKVLEASIPEHPSRTDPAWLLFPLGTPLPVALADSSLTEAVEALLRLARTLEGLHRDGIFHRDVKPENILQLGTDFVFGDFGLADFPNKQEITHLREDGRGPGPLYYLAPELLLGKADDPAAADVYAFAKTMWVTGTGQRYPIQGPLDSASEATRLSAFINDPRARLLDRLLHRATLNEADSRPNMAEIADELEAWLVEPTGASIPDVDDLVAGIVAASEPSRRREEELSNLIALASESLRALVEQIMPLEEAFDKMGLRRVPRDVDDIVLRSFRRPQTMGTPRIINETGMATRVFVERGGFTYFLATGYGMQLRENGAVELGAGHVVGFLTGGGRENLIDRWIWTTESVNVGSAAEEKERREVAALVSDAFPRALAKFQSVLTGT